MNCITIKTPDAASSFTVGDKLLSMERNATFEKTTQQINVSTSNWLVFYNFKSEEPLEVYCNNSWYKLPQDGFAYMAPFSIVEWRFPKGEISFSMDCTFGPPLTHAPENPAAFPLSHPVRRAMSCDFIKSVFESNKGINLDRRTASDALVRRTKEYIASKFNEDLKILSIAKELNTNRSVMTRQFKNCYGISPIEYRTKLRVVYAHELLLYEKSTVGQTALEVGFQDPKQFAKHFKDATSLTPKHYLSNKG